MDHYTVIGNPIEHSLSPILHKLFAEQTEQKIIYDKTLAPLDGFAKSVFTFIEKGGRGANVTVPFKQEAFQIVHHLSERALQAQSVNTLTFMPNAVIKGDNTDGIGFIKDLQNNHRFLIAGKRVLILGSGGAVLGMLPAILAENPLEIVIASRKEIPPNPAFSKGGIKNMLFQRLTDFDNGRFDLIINATSAGLKGQVPELPGNFTAKNAYCYDLSYGKAAAPFAQWARQYGADRVLDGFGMLVEQAAEAFYVWRGVRPDTRMVLEKQQDIIFRHIGMSKLLGNN